MLKRGIDIVGSLFGLILLSPVFATGNCSDFKFLMVFSPQWTQSALGIVLKMKRLRWKITIQPRGTLRRI